MADQPIDLVDHTQSDSVHTTTSPQPPPEPVPNSHIDILLENQRGWFIFGIPLFSSKALWNLRIDPAPWVDANNKPSAVNITNAQVPDPSWVWDWKSWYVDMSLDVDEEGWQYSLLFKGSAWHGNHPWFHSFVRRRRWLRKRIKQKVLPKTKANQQERLFGETFSLAATLARMTTTGTATPSAGDSAQTSVDEEIRDAATMMNKLKRATIDREKIIIVLRFVDDGGEELYYFADKIPAIMAMLVFQHSRRQLLSTLMDRFDSAKDHRCVHSAEKAPEDEAQERRIHNLQRAIEAADEECHKLEYWSDIRDLAEDSKADNATESSK